MRFALAQVEAVAELNALRQPWRAVTRIVEEIDEQAVLCRLVHVGKGLAGALHHPLAIIHIQVEHAVPIGQEPAEVG